MKLKSLLEKILGALEKWLERHVVARDPDDVAAEEAEQETTDRIHAEEADGVPETGNVADGVPEAGKEVPSPVDSVSFADLHWDVGGFNGSGAGLVDGVRIGSLSVKSSGMSYKWESGGCERLGAANAEDASCIAALFCLVDGRWRGGKFDWISTSRKTRDFKNVNEGYNGWNPSWLKASKFAFVIVSKDGRKRSNVCS